MKLTVRDIDLTGLTVSSEQAVSRTAGIHVSGIIRNIKSALSKESGFDETALEWFAIVGRLWERIMAEALFTPPQFERVGEIEMDNIIGSPDAIDTASWSVAEFKVTWKSERDFAESQRFREYLWQVKSYCNMLGMVRCRLIVFFVCGNWRPPIPMAKEYDLLFTPQELAENWLMMQRNIPA